MRTYSHQISETRWRYNPNLYRQEIQKRYGIVYRQKKYWWDFFRWFDIQTVEWGDWRPSPEELAR